jgi:phytoene dehydrogenase-like protein
MSGADTQRRRYDCIIIGAGHNGLVAAAYLARSGRSVLVLEAAAQVGGAAVTREFMPGFRVSSGAHRLNMLSSAIIEDLGLEKHGLKFVARRTPTVALTSDGATLLLNDADDSISGASPGDAAAYQSYSQSMRRFAAALRPTLEAIPPRLGTDEWKDKVSLLKLGWAIRKLGRKDMRELLRIGGMNVHDLLEDQFESKSLQGALAIDAILGANAGPRTPGTVLNLLYRHAAQSGANAHAGVQVEGGMGAVTKALAQAALAAGAAVRTDTPVARVEVEDDKTKGVILESGDQIAAPVVISNADPKTSFLQLLGAEHLDTGFVRRISHLRTRGVTAKLHLALSSAPRFSGVRAAGARSGSSAEADSAHGRWLIAPTLADIEHAYNHSKYGEFSARPVMEITVPTFNDAGLAPPERHVLSAVVQYAPYVLKEGWEAGKPSFLKAVMDRLEQHAPGLSQQVLGAELLTPVDLEREFRITGGHWHHTDLAFDQFYMVRPVPGSAQYSTPMKGFYLCGAGAHPGGGVNGLAGRNAARRILAGG